MVDTPETSTQLYADAADNQAVGSYTLARLRKIIASFTAATPVSVKQYGVIGDGVTDDTVALQSAIDSAVPVLYFPAGVYSIPTTLKLGSQQIWKGEGQGKTIITTAQTSTPLLWGDLGALLTNFEIHDMTLRNTSPSPSIDASLLVIWYGFHNVLIENVTFDFPNHAILADQLSCTIFLTGSDNLKVRNCTFSNCGRIPLEVTDSMQLGNVAGMNITIEGCRFVNNNQTSEYQVISISGEFQNIMIANNSFEESGVIEIAGSDFSIVGNTFKNYNASGTAKPTGIQAGFGFHGVVSANQIDAFIPADHGAIQANNSSDVVFSGNSVRAGGSGYGFLVKESSNVTVIGNHVSVPTVLATANITGTSLSITAWTDIENTMLWNGMSVAGTGIPDSTTISNVVYVNGLASMTLSHSSTTGTAVAVTFGDGIYGIGLFDTLTNASVIGNHVDLSGQNKAGFNCIHADVNIQVALEGNYLKMGARAGGNLAAISGVDPAYIGTNYIDDTHLYTGVAAVYSRFLMEYPTTGITAASAQGGLTLTTGMNVVTTATNSTYGVTLPVAIPGRKVSVVNNTDGAINVWPTSGGTINDSDTNVAFVIALHSLASGSQILFEAISTTQWVTENKWVYSGTTLNRPVNVPIGFMYYDTTIAKPLWFGGTTWADTAGTVSYSPSFDSANRGTYIVLSNHNLTVTHSNATVAENTVLTNNSFTTGKYYFEMTLTAEVDTDSIGIGFGNASTNLNSFSGVDTNSISYFTAGYIFYTNSAVHTAENYVAGDVVSIAVDFGGALFWVRRNGGNWNNDVSANPATGTNGYALTITGPYFICATTNANGDSLTVKFQGSAMAHSIPSGFSTFY